MQKNNSNNKCNDKRNIICLLGLKTMGKDYSAKNYYEPLGYKKIALADTLRDILWNILGFEPTKDGVLSYNSIKKLPLYTEYDKTILGGLVKIHQKTFITTFRKMLQNIGDVFKNMFGEDFWVKTLIKKIKDTDGDIVVTDVRFVCEIKELLKLHRKGFNVEFRWCFYGPNFSQELLLDQHRSEALAQHIVYNNHKYELNDQDVISHYKIKNIIKDFNEIK